jgi:hypothetical protein
MPYSGWGGGARRRGAEPSRRENAGGGIKDPHSAAGDEPEQVPMQVTNPLAQSPISG